MSKVIDDVLAERVRQDDMHGVQDHDLAWWLAILVEEVGELVRESLEMKFEHSMDHGKNLRREAIHVAAVAVAIVEWIDCRRRKGRALVGEVR